MSKRLTKEEFIMRAVARHGLSYSYDKTTYINNSVKVTIFCNKHLIDFEQSPNKHMAGQGCPICRYDKTSINNSKTTEDFISSAIKIHGDTYCYRLVHYTAAHEFVKIRCKRHDVVFDQKATNHLAGKGCKLCAEESVKKHLDSLILTKEEFVDRAIKVHGPDLYDYSTTIYLKSVEKVDIWCNRHKGYFKQSPNNHLSGTGCASCAKTGYSTNRPGKFYVLVCKELTKVGITNFDPLDRAQKVSKSFGDEFLLKRFYEFTDGTLADRLETNVLRELKKRYARPTKRFEGHSECFIDVDYENLLFLINQELELLKETYGT